MKAALPIARQAYFEQVWRFVRQVPFAKVVTYGQISQALPKPVFEYEEQLLSESQLVGTAMASCPEDVPWHRVINAQGRVSSRADAGRQQQMLESEGVCFFHGRLSLDEFQWRGHSDDEKPRQHSLF